METTAPVPEVPWLQAWSLLGAVRFFSVEVRRGGGGNVRIDRGAGRIAVEQREEAETVAIIWREHGRWTTGPLAGLAFHNSTLWRYRPGEPCLELSHLRRGDDAPTLLVMISPDATGAWRSSHPHQCGLDSYHAQLSWTDNRLELCWDVTSPTDPYRLRLTARPDAPHESD